MIPSNPDKRTHAYRPDLADATLEKVVTAERYVTGHPAQVVVPELTLRRGPGDSTPQDSELLMGDIVDVFDRKDGWAWVQNQRDRYVGYCPETGLSDSPEAPTHYVSTLRTLIFPEPDLKRKPLGALSLTGRVTATEETDKYTRISTGGWIYSRHLKPLDTPLSSPLEVARLYMNAPYLWGGNNSLGLDCSGLVQMAFRACGIDTPRDTDQQEREIGTPVPFDGEDTSNIRTGDLIFWPGHVGFLEQNGNLLHANATDMMVSSAPLTDVAAHIRRLENNPISSIRRADLP